MKTLFPILQDPAIVELGDTRTFFQLCYHAHTVALIFITEKSPIDTSKSIILPETKSLHDLF